MFKRLGWLLLALAVVSMPVSVDAAGGSSSGGGGGGSAGVSLRLVGYATGIDYVNGRIMIGQLYYGSGVLGVDSNTRVTINNVAATLNDIQLNNLCEVRYDSITRVATKIAVTR